MDKTYTVVVKRTGDKPAGIRCDMTESEALAWIARRGEWADTYRLAETFR